jgi:hypothetical protein
MPRTRKSNTQVELSMLDLLNEIKQDNKLLTKEIESLKKRQQELEEQNQNLDGNRNTNNIVEIDGYSAAEEAAGIENTNLDSCRQTPTPMNFHAPVCNLPTFDGNGRINKFMAHFEDICTLNNWTTAYEKGIWLKICLAGHARDVLYDNTSNFNIICSRLQTRFGEHLLKQKYEMLLPLRKRQPKETLYQLASDIRQMVNIVYDELDHTTIERMAIRHFITALESLL